MLTEILYEDKAILVVRKPAGLATQTARVGQQDVVGELKGYLWRSEAASGASAGKPEPYLGIVHRLDQPVEGLLVFAKTKRATAALTEQLQGDGGGFSKRYYAVLCGVPAREEGELVDYLEKQSVFVGRHQEYKAVLSAPSQAQEEFTKARRAKLSYRTLQIQESQQLALADICIETGRFHQIRAQMSHAGMPLLGDMKYGSEETKAKAQTLGIRNVALCAYQLEFIHPVRKERMDFRIKPRNEAFSFFSQL